jgi:hypothetical protein
MDVWWLRLYELMTLLNASIRRHITMNYVPMQARFQRAIELFDLFRFNVVVQAE